MIPANILHDAIEGTRPFTEEERAKVMETVELANEAHRALLRELEQIRKFDKWSLYGLAATAWIGGFGFGVLWG